MRRVWIVFLLIGCLLSGCSGQREPGTFPVVVEIRVSTPSVQRVYREQEKMKAILTYLRLMEPMGPAGKVSPLMGEEAEICLILSNGTGKIHRMRDAAFFRHGQISWQRIQPEYAELLQPLLQILPSDPL